MLQKLEADVRQHIRIEQQLKLHIESIQEKIEEDEKVIEQYQEEKDRFLRENKRMDEMLTIRETEIDKLESNLKLLNNMVKVKESKIKELQENLDEAKLSLEEQKFALDHERKLQTKFHKLNNGKLYSKSNDRRDNSNNPENKAPQAIISQSSLTKKPVSRMYASLYNTNQVPSKGAPNTNEMKNYEKLYKDFLKSKKYENPKQIMEEHRSTVFSNSGVMSSS